MAKGHVYFSLTGIVIFGNFKTFMYWTPKLFDKTFSKNTEKLFKNSLCDIITHAVMYIQGLTVEDFSLFLVLSGFGIDSCTSVGDAKVIEEKKQQALPFFRPVASWQKEI